MSAERAKAALRRSLFFPDKERFEPVAVRKRGKQLLWCVEASVEHGADVARLHRESRRVHGSCYVSDNRVALYVPAGNAPGAGGLSALFACLGIFGLVYYFRSSFSGMMGLPPIQTYQYA